MKKPMGERMNLVFVGSHLGYPMERTPLGGGAMVGLQLVRQWGAAKEIRLLVLGSGSQPPAPGVDYVQLPKPPAGAADPDLVRLSEWGYARFCRRFEEATTRYILDRAAGLDPRRTVIAVNDISESPDLPRLAQRGYRILSIWHVDVVEFFNRIYLRELLAPERLTQAFGWAVDRGMGGLVPDVLKLVFQKQQDAVKYSDRLVLPSRQMAETIQRCYAHLPQNGKAPLPQREMVLPWGGWGDEVGQEEVAREAQRLRAHYQIAPQTRVVMTLSRISPEKGIHLLLEALGRLEGSARFAGADICLFVCGEPAFMRGAAYDRKVRRAAEKLKRIRVFFPGYLSAFDKQAYFRLAHLFVSPSIHESYGLTLVEAMRAGLPILASDHYGVDEILGPEFGRAVSYRGRKDIPGLLARELERLLSDLEGLRRMGGRAREAASGMTFTGAARRLLDAALALAGPK